MCQKSTFFGFITSLHYGAHHIADLASSLLSTEEQLCSYNMCTHTCTRTRAHLYRHMYTDIDTHVRTQIHMPAQPYADVCPCTHTYKNTQVPAQHAHTYVRSDAYLRVPVPCRHTYICVHI